MKNYLGIWMDQKEAKMIQFENGKSKIQTIPSDIEDYHVVGGSRSKQPWGPMDNVSESKMLDRKKQQTKRYFQKLMDLMNEQNEVYLFGPAETKTQFFQTVANNKSLNVSVKKVDTAGSMTERQMIAQVRKIFGLSPSKS